MADRINGFKVTCIGGMNTNRDVLSQGEMYPGSATQLINYEPAITGGYRRISGYANSYGTVTGTGNVVATITLYSSTAAGTIGSIMTLRGSTIPITAPITCVGAVCQFDINLRNGIPLTNPGRIFVKSSSGGVSGPFVVA
jgi:hypothetical protein